jgi:tetratricopeptide (TPR) repeat protein
MKKLIISINLATALIGAILAEPATTANPARVAEQLFQQGAAAEKAGDTATAEARYTAALKANPNHADARFSLGQIKINSGAITAQVREAKIGAVMIPIYQLENATFQDALSILSQKIETESKQSLTPNFIIEDPQGKFAAQ